MKLNDHLINTLRQRIATYQRMAHYYDAAESPQWNRETIVREANQRMLDECRRELVKLGG